MQRFAEKLNIFQLNKVLIVLCHCGSVWQKGFIKSLEKKRAVVYLTGASTLSHASFQTYGLSDMAAYYNNNGICNNNYFFYRFTVSAVARIHLIRYLYGKARRLGNGVSFSPCQQTQKRGCNPVRKGSRKAHFPTLHKDKRAHL